jgi:hypothetical protein
MAVVMTGSPIAIAPEIDRDMVAVLKGESVEAYEEYNESGGA